MEIGEEAILILTLGQRRGGPGRNSHSGGLGGGEGGDSYREGPSTLGGPYSLGRREDPAGGYIQ